MSFDLPPQVAYVGLLFGLFVFPRILQRWRVPAAITSLALGAIAGPGLGLFEHDNTIKLLSTLGIVALFLFAGLEVSVADLRRESKVMGEHLAIRLVGLALVAAAAHSWLGLDTRAAILVSLALLTPSLVAMIVGLPWLFRVFARFIVPHAPKIGVRLLADDLGDLRARDEAARRLLSRDDFTLGSLGFAALFLAIGVPLGLFMAVLHRNLRLGESIREGVRVGGPMLPTLVFTLVIAQILRDRFGASPAVFGGLVIYALVNTVIPSFLFRTPPVELETPEAPELDEASRAIASLDPGPPPRSLR